MNRREILKSFLVSPLASIEAAANIKPSIAEGLEECEWPGRGHTEFCEPGRRCGSDCTYTSARPSGTFMHSAIGAYTGIALTEDGSFERKMYPNK